MRSTAAAGHALERLERRPELDRARLEELDALLPHLKEPELDRLVELLATEPKGWERVLDGLLGPARSRRRRATVALWLGAARRELSSRRPEPPRLERVKGGWLARSQSVEILFAFDPTPEAELPEVEADDTTAEPSVEPIPTAEPSEPPAPARSRPKKRPALTGREWLSQSSRRPAALPEEF